MMNITRRSSAYMLYQTQAMPAAQYTPRLKYDAVRHYSKIKYTSFLQDRANYFSFGIFVNTGWPRKNATTLIFKFKNIINKTETEFLFYFVEISFSNKMTP